MVTVRARLQPEVGLEQWLQVPGYWEKKGDQPANELTRTCSPEAEQLRADFDAAARLAAGLRELQRTGDAIGADLRLAVETTRDRMVTRMRDSPTGAVGRWRRCASTAGGSADGAPAAVRTSGRALATLVEPLKALARRVARPRHRRRVALAARTARRRSSRRSTPSRSGAAPEIDAAAPRSPRRTRGARRRARREKPAIAELQHDLATNWKTSLDALFAAPAETKQALEAARPLVDEGAALLRAVARAAGRRRGSIPHPPGELPPVDLDLQAPADQPGRPAEARGRLLRPRRDT